ncbi:MAG: DUF2207 domain-containing protein [Coriobacteriales bacterium]|jgi:flagellar basal body-associated protein FliL|nr:DUF2207 domain-containing protein [Coriobacteriales bacterium]
MTTLETGFVFDTAAVLALVLSVLVVLAAVVLFFVFGKKREQISSGPLLFQEFQRYPRAVVGAFFKGNQKEVGAQEYLATLMALTHRGTLVLDYDEEGQAVALRRGRGPEGLAGREEDALLPGKTGEESGNGAEREGGGSGESSEREGGDALDASALAILWLFAEDDGRVHLSSAKARGAARTATIDPAYRAWRQQVKSEAEAEGPGAFKTAFIVRQALLYAGYVLILLAAVCAYLISLMASVILLVAGAILIVLSFVMQNRIDAERQNARRFYLWLDSLAEHIDELPTDRHSIQVLLEFACLFALADKLAPVLRDTLDSPELAEETAPLAFWKDLRSALYTTS